MRSRGTSAPVASIAFVLRSRPASRMSQVLLVVVADRVPLAVRVFVARLPLFMSRRQYTPQNRDEFVRARVASLVPSRNFTAVVVGGRFVVLRHVADARTVQSPPE